ncbi:hypothetical protein Tco_0773874, partial [Tanacetum coccineum]
KYGNNWQVDDAIADEILDNLLKRELQKKGTFERIENVENNLNKAKEKMNLNKRKEKMVMKRCNTSFEPLHSINESSDHNPFQVTSDDNSFQVSTDDTLKSSSEDTCVCEDGDVAFAISMTNRHQQNPCEAHRTAVKITLKYFRKTKDMFSVYRGLNEDLTIRCYTYASFQTDRDDTRSQSSYVFTLNRGAIVWKSSKKSTITMSTAKSEYFPTPEAAKEVVWIRKFIMI